MNSPEHNPESAKVKRLQQFAYFVRELATQKDAKFETNHTGFRLSLIDGLSLYIHTGSDDLSTVQQLDLLSSDAYIDVSFSAHSTSGEVPDGIKGRIYRIGKFGVRVARSEATPDAQPADEPTEQATDTETLWLTTILSRTIFRNKID